MFLRLFVVFFEPFNYREVFYLIWWQTLKKLAMYIHSHNLSCTHTYNRSTIQLQLISVTYSGTSISRKFFCGLAQQIADHTAWSRLQYNYFFNIQYYFLLFFPPLIIYLSNFNLNLKFLFSKQVTKPFNPNKHFKTKITSFQLVINVIKL